MVRPGATTRNPRVKLLALAAYGVDGLPGDEHRHDGRLAGAGGELQREPRQLRVGVALAFARWSRNALARLAELRRDLGQPDGSLDGLDLAEERADAAEIVMCASAGAGARFRA